MDNEFTSWIKVMGAVVFLVGLGFFYHDYSTAPTEWRPGVVTDKEVSRTYSDHQVFPVNATYYIRVRAGDTNGHITVMRYTYDDWHVGDACEVCCRHGHFMTYVTDIRPVGGRVYDSQF
jgi:hypothetical protein